MYLFLICILIFALLQSVRRTDSNVFALTKERCDILKAVLPILIIVHHHSQSWHYPTGLHEDFLLAGAAVVWLFFAISGYGLAYSRATDRLHNKNIFQRVWGLYLPTIVPIGFFFLALVIFKGEVISQFVRCLRSGYFPLPFAWFIQALAMLYAAFYLADRLCKSRICFNIALCALCAVIMIAFRLLGAPAYFYSSDIGFLVGVFYCQYEDSVLHFLADKAKYIFISVMVVNAALCVFALMKYNMILKGAWILSVLAVLPFVELKVTRATKFLSRISYEIYLCQGVAFILIIPMDLSAIPSLALVIALTLGLAYVSKEITSKYLGKLSPAQPVRHRNFTE